MKVTALLEQQHRSVAAIFEQLRAGRSDPSPLLTKLADVLAAHMAIEQNLLYPAVRDLDPDLVDASYEEHAIAELALKRLLKTDPREMTFDARVDVLANLIDDHVDQEEAQLFPAIERALGEAALEALGEQLEEAFRAALNDGFSALVPQTLARTSADDARDALSKPQETVGVADGPGTHPH
jgi:hemerythrin-like domain-containing protein